VTVRSVRRVRTPSPDELIYDAAIRAIDRQQATVSELRHGASLMIATAAIAISLLDEASLAGPGAPLAWLAIAAFSIVSGSALAATWPQRGLPPVPDVGAMVLNLTTQAYGSGALEPNVLRREYMVSMAMHQHLHAQRIMRVSRAVRIGTVALVVQLLATVASRALMV
jgi:hypothetical protein